MRAAQAEPRFADATGKLDRYAEWARAMPFAFYARIGVERGRKRFLARLGHEAEDALDEFLNLALGYERRETRRCKASLDGCARRVPM